MLDRRGVDEGATAPALAAAVPPIDDEVPF